MQTQNTDTTGSSQATGTATSVTQSSIYSTLGTNSSASITTINATAVTSTTTTASTLINTTTFFNASSTVSTVMSSTSMATSSAVTSATSNYIHKSNYETSSTLLFSSSEKTPLKGFNTSLVSNKNDTHTNNVNKSDYLGFTAKKESQHVLTNANATATAITNAFTAHAYSFTYNLKRTNKTAKILNSYSKHLKNITTITANTATSHAKSLLLIESNFANQTSSNTTQHLLASYFMENLKNFKSQFKISEKNSNKYLSNKSIIATTTSTTTTTTTTIHRPSSASVHGFTTKKNLNKPFSSKPLDLFIERYNKTNSATSTTTTTTTATKAVNTSAVTKPSKHVDSHLFVDKYHDQIYPHVSLNDSNGSSSSNKKQTKTEASVYDHSESHNNFSTTVNTTDTNTNTGVEEISDIKKPTIIYSELNNIKEKYKSFLQGKHSHTNINISRICLL